MKHSSKSTDETAFQRDRYTVYLYLILALVGFKQSVLGSILPLIKDEMALGPIQIGWHFSIYALGLILSAQLVKALAQSHGLSKTLNWAGFGMVTTIFVIAFGTTLILTLSLALVLGLAGGTAQIVVMSKLSTHHQSNRAVAIVEANVLAAVGVFLGPLCIGFTAGYDVGWRGVLVLPLITLLLINSLFSVERNFDAQPSFEADCGYNPGARLPLAAIVVLSMIFFGIATEWGIGFWGALFLESQLNMSTDEAVTYMSIFFGGTVFGRIVVSRLLLRFPLRAILVILIVLGGLSIVILTESFDHELAFGALFVGGACLGNFFPLILALANEIATSRATDVSRVATFTVGAALLVVPYLIGNIGELAGLRTAVRMLSFFPAVMLILYIISNLAKIQP